jgi:hypothetical protein
VHPLHGRRFPRHRNVAGIVAKLIDFTLLSITSRPIAMSNPRGSGATTARTLAARHPSTVTSILATGPHAFPTDGLLVQRHESPTCLTMRSASLDDMTVLGRADDTMALGVRSVSLRRPQRSSPGLRPSKSQEI